jgi:membrane-associated phospholipid phosphatase
VEERRVILVFILGGLLLAGSAAGARLPEIHPLERRAFRLLNGLPGWLYVPLWLPMQLGNLVAGTAAGLAIAAWYRNWLMALGVVIAAGLKLVAERVIRGRTADYLAVRQRPGTSQPGAILRGDVPSSGPSFPSGHVILVSGVACVVLDSIPDEVVWLPFTLTALVTVARVYVGAHNPLDVTAGLGTGLLVGGILAQWVV